MALADAARPLDAAHPGHLDIHHDHVGTRPVRDVQGLLGRCRLADALDAVCVVKDQAQARPQHAVVVDKQNADRGVGHRWVPLVG